TDVPEILIRAGKLVNKMLPNFTIKLEIDPEKLTSNHSFSQELLNTNHKFPPILLMYGTEDKISNTEVTKKFYGY
ncbi:26016_t:CDS:2, partial [Racocetra persica]